MPAWNITFENLTLGYDGRAVIKNLGATLPAGKISVILGGSGSGKSTILRHIAGLQKPMSGKIIIGSEDICAMPRAAFRRLRRRMGVLFQDGALLGALTVAKNVALPLSEHLRLSRRLLEEAAERALGLVGLNGFGDYFPGQLSGGMRKRAGLARAIIADPLLLLCDEPTSGLDPITAARMDDLLLALRRQYPEMTMVVVSHDLASVRRIADFVLLLRDGAAVFAGGMAELEASSNEYLRQFLAREPGSAPASATAPPIPQVRAALEKWLNS